MAMEGGTGGAVVVVPTPTPTTMPTPNPTPTPAGTTLLDFSGNQQFDTIESILQYEKRESGLSVLADNGFSFNPTNSLAFFYDAPTTSRYYFFNGPNVPPHNSFANFYSAPLNLSTRVSADSVFTSYRAIDKGATYKVSAIIYLS